MLLSHTSSLRDDAGYAFPLTSNLRDVMTHAMWSPRAAPGAFFTYCNLGFGIIGTIMERVTGERFDRLMQRLILSPLGMRGGYNVAELAPQDLANLATLYRKRTVDTEVWNLHGPWIAQVDAGRPAPLPGIASYVPGTNATPFSPTGSCALLTTSSAVIEKFRRLIAPASSSSAARTLRSRGSWRAIAFSRHAQMKARSSGLDSERPAKSPRPYATIERPASG